MRDLIESRILSRELEAARKPAALSRATDFAAPCLGD